MDPMTAAAAINAGTNTANSAINLLFHKGQSTAKSEKMLWLENMLADRRMKNAHQWEAEDLAKAGLNKALTASQASAGSIAGSTAGMGTLAEMAGVEQSGRNTRLNGAINSAMKAMDFFNEVQRVINEGELKDAQIENTDADTANKNLNNGLLLKYGDKEKNAEIARTLQETENIKANTAKQNAEMQAIGQNIIQNAPQTQQDKQYYKFLNKHPTIAAGINTVNRISEIGGNLMGMIGGAAKPVLAAKAVNNFRKLNTETVSRYNSKGILTSVTERHRY